MSTENQGVRLGDLLTTAGLLRVEALREAMHTAKQQQMPVGRILITSGYLTENQLQAAVQAQSLLKDGLVEMPVVIKALGILANEQGNLEQALAKCGWKRQSGTVSNKLGELLLEAALVSDAAFSHALAQCQNIGLPLGRMLVLTGALSEQMLSSTLNAQVLLRDKKITRDQAVKGLKAAQQRHLPLENALAESDVLQLPRSTSIRLGELLTDAGLIDQANFLNAVELGLLQDKLIGQVLRQLNLLTEGDLMAALELQKLVSVGSIGRAEAIEMLKAVHKTKSTLVDLLNQRNLRESQNVATIVDREELLFDQFLKIAGIITQSEIEKAIKVGSRNSDLFGKMLLTASILQEQMVEASLDAYALVSDNTLTMEQAMIALKNCLAKGHDLESAFRDLGWSADSPQASVSDQALPGQAELSQATVSPPENFKLSEPVEAQADLSSTTAHDQITQEAIPDRSSDSSEQFPGQTDKTGSTQRPDTVSSQTFFYFLLHPPMRCPRRLRRKR